ncbi:MAG TPA: MFS transporter [Dermatophilaceae bacterium]|nr:MFS transporter [Dermatophilaceae bacterium]
METTAKALAKDTSTHPAPHAATHSEGHSATHSETAPDSATRGAQWLGMAAVLAAILMNLLDATIVNVAAPTIRAELGASYAQLQWIAAVYTLALAMGLLVGGRLGDMFGRRRMLLVGVTGFTLASLACAAATSSEALIGARAAQGLLGALMVPQTFGLIRDLFPPQDIGKAFAALGPAIGLATILGPVVAGFLVDADLFGTGWRAVFGINLPLGIFALAVGARFLPRVEPSARGMRLDATGAVLAGLGMLLLVYPLVQGREHGWPAWIFGMAAVAVGLLAAFVAHQRRRVASGGAPLVELGVFRRRSYASGVAFVVVFFGAIVGFSLAMGLFLQLGLGRTPVRASLTMAAWAIGAFLGSGFAAATMARLERRILHLGLAVMTAGLTAVYAVIRADGTAVGGWNLSLPLLAYGFGMGMIFVPLFDVIMGEVQDHEVGSASGLLESVQQLASALGVAALGTVFFSTVGSAATAGSFVAAIERVALIAVGLAILAQALAFFLPQRARRQELQAEAAEYEAMPA